MYTPARITDNIPELKHFECVIKKFIKSGEHSVVLLVSGCNAENVSLSSSNYVLKLYRKACERTHAFRREFAAYNALYPSPPAAVPKCFGYVKLANPRNSLSAPPKRSTISRHVPKTRTRGILFEYIPPSYHKITIKDTEEYQDVLRNALLSALEEIHQRGVAHRDLAPRNLLIRPSDDGVDVKIIDFDMAETRGWSDADKWFKHQRTRMSQIASGDPDCWFLL